MLIYNILSLSSLFISVVVGSENCPMIATSAGRKLQLNHRPGVILTY